MEARRRTLRISPLSHPEERPAVPLANDLRRLPGQVGRVGGIRYLPYEWASASRRRTLTLPRDPGAKRGGTAEAAAFVPAWGDCMRLSAVSSSRDLASLRSHADAASSRPRRCPYLVRPRVRGAPVPRGKGVAMQLNSDRMKGGLSKAPHRSLLKADGLTDEEISRPLVAVINSAERDHPGPPDARQDRRTRSKPASTWPAGPRSRSRRSAYATASR